MATLIISRYAAIERNVGKTPVGSQSLTTSGTSTQSAANSNGAAAISLYSDAAHYYCTGENPTASSTTGAYVPAGQLVWGHLPLGHKVAAVTA